MKSTWMVVLAALLVFPACGKKKREKKPQPPNMGRYLFGAYANLEHGQTRAEVASQTGRSKDSLSQDSPLSQAETAAWLDRITDGDARALDGCLKEASVRFGFEDDELSWVAMRAESTCTPKDLQTRMEKPARGAYGRVDKASHHVDPPHPETWYWEGRRGIEVRLDLATHLRLVVAHEDAIVLPLPTVARSVPPTP